MAHPEYPQGLDQAFDQIEKAILPGISVLLDALLDAASLARAGTEGNDFPAELRILTLQLEAVTRQVEALSLIQFETRDYQPLRGEADRKISA